MTTQSELLAIDVRENATAQPAAPRLRPARIATIDPVVPLANLWYARLKGVLDVCLAVALLPVILPAVAVAAVMVKLTSRGPAFYSQTRVGLGGKLFTIWKIRSMRHNAESLTGAQWSLPGDPRVTLVGWFLRLSHIDELPQILNVLRGDMSLIGPRPERPEFVPELERALPAYRQRLNVRPGVTGLAQVHLPPDTDLDSVRRKLAHDLYYIRALSPWMDLRILVCTALYALAIPFRLTRRLVGLPVSENIERAMRDVVSDKPIPVAPSRRAA